MLKRWKGEELAKRTEDRSSTPTSSGKTVMALRACTHFAPLHRGGSKGLSRRA